jgi:NNP family nitrate/nitrite transporter-like MFS transporter
MSTPSSEPMADSSLPGAPEVSHSSVGGTGATGAVEEALGGRTAVRMRILATVGFALCFWAWALISPLGSAYSKQFRLNGFQQALLVAVPVVVGSLGRIPVGGLTDRFGARMMFPAVSALTILPVLFVGFFGHSFALVLVGGFFLGVGGTSSRWECRWSTRGFLLPGGGQPWEPSGPAWAAPPSRRSAP